MRRTRFHSPSPSEPTSTSVPDLNSFLARLGVRLDELEARLRSIELERPKDRPRYASPDELAREFGIPDQTLRGWLFSRAENGLDALVIAHGRRLYLDRVEFAR